jgi:hypothetical protein
MCVVLLIFVTVNFYTFDSCLILFTRVVQRSSYGCHSNVVIIVITYNMQECIIYYLLCFCVCVLISFITYMLHWFVYYHMVGLVECV